VVGRPYPPPGSPERLWPPLANVLFAIVIQVLLDSRLIPGPPWLIPTLEGVLLVNLIAISPRQLTHRHRARRRLMVSLTAIVSAANVFALGSLTNLLLERDVSDGRALIVSGTFIWLTNVSIFALWYWEIDRGGPGQRAEGQDGPPDFLFPQMADDRIEPANWRPKFVDYLYVSLTNATAFSPTDTMPLSHGAKAMMGLQAVISLLTIGLIVSRAVNIL
jgi:hypothetical protein